jgi:hypothetical protein
MTASGRLLSGAMKYGDRRSLAPALEQVLKDYSRLPDGERRPEKVESEVKPVPAPPAGGAVLTIYDRPLGRVEGTYRLPKERDLGGLRTEAPAGQRSSIWLTRDECQSLIPKTPQAGQSNRVDATLAKRILLYGLWPQTLWVVEYEWRADSLREGELHTTVVEVSASSIRLRIHGSSVLATPSRLKVYPTGKFAKELENRYEAHLEGVLVYDRERQRIVQWDMVALGDYTGVMFTTREENGKNIGDTQWREATRDAAVPLAFSFELDKEAYEATPERRRPRSFVHAYIFREREQFYWEPAKWEQDWHRRNQQ